MLTGQRINPGIVVATHCHCGELVDRFGEPEEIANEVLGWSLVTLEGPNGPRPGWLMCFDFGHLRAVYFSGWPIGFPDLDITTVVLKLNAGSIT